MTLRSASRWLALPLLGACVGGQTGGSSVGPTCLRAEPRSVELSDASHLGFAAEDVLAFAQGDHAYAARWPLASPAPARAELRITRAAARARFVEAHWSQGGALPEHECPDTLEVDVTAELTLRNAEGAASAAFDAVLETSAAGRARLHHLLLPETFEGDLQFALRGDEALLNLELLARFVRGQSSGDLVAVVADSERVGSVAQWPIGEACGEGGHAVPLDSLAVGVPPQDAVHGIPRELAVTWQDGSSTMAALDLVAVGSPCITAACASWCPSMHAAVDPGGEPRIAIEIPVRIQVATADERWLGRFAASIWMEVFETGRLARGFLRHEAQHASGDALAAELGLTGVVAGGPVKSVLLLELTPPSDQPLFIGAFAVAGSLAISGAMAGEPDALAASFSAAPRPPGPRRR